MTDMIPDLSRTRSARAAAEPVRASATPTEGFGTALDDAIGTRPEGFTSEDGPAGQSNSQVADDDGATLPPAPAPTAGETPANEAARSAFARLTERGVWHRALGVGLGRAEQAAAAAAGGTTGFPGAPRVDTAPGTTDLEAVVAATLPHDGHRSIPLDQALSHAAASAAQAAAVAAAAAASDVTGEGHVDGSAASGTAPTAGALAPGTAARAAEPTVVAPARPSRPASGVQGAQDAAAQAAAVAGPQAQVAATAGDASAAGAGVVARSAGEPQVPPAQAAPAASLRVPGEARDAEQTGSTARTSATGRPMVPQADAGDADAATPAPVRGADLAPGGTRASEMGTSRAADQAFGAASQGRAAGQTRVDGPPAPAAAAQADAAGRAGRAVADLAASSGTPISVTTAGTSGASPAAGPTSPASAAAGAGSAAVPGPAADTGASAPAGPTASAVAASGQAAGDAAVTASSSGVPDDSGDPTARSAAPAAQTPVSAEVRQGAAGLVSDDADAAVVFEPSTGTDDPVGPDLGGDGAPERAASDGRPSHSDSDSRGGDQPGRNPAGAARDAQRPDVVPFGGERGFTAAASAPVVSAAAPTPGSAPAAAPLHAQLMQGLEPTLRRGDGTHQIELQLAPAHLGRVRISVEIRGGEISIVMNAADANARELLKGNVDDLRQQLSQMGLNAGSVDVDAQGHADGGDAWQQMRDSQAQARRAAARGDGTGFPGDLDPTSSGAPAGASSTPTPAGSPSDDLAARL